MDTEDRIDIKTFYRSIEKTLQSLNYDFNHDRLKQLVLDQDTTKNKTEKMIKQYANAFKYVIHNLNEYFSEQIIVTIYFILTLKKLSQKKVDSIMIAYHSLIDEGAHYKAAMLHKSIYDLNVVHKQEFAFLLSNYILLKNNLNPLILYYDDKKNYVNAIKMRNKDINHLINFIFFNEYNTRKTFIKRFEKTRTEAKDIIKKIRENKDYFMSNYPIDKIFLFGSYAKNNQHVSSDVDLLVSFKKEKVYSPMSEIIFKLERDVEQWVNRIVDISEITASILIFKARGQEQVIRIL